MKTVILKTGIAVSVFLLFGCAKEPTSLSSAPGEKGSATISLIASTSSAFGSIARTALAMVTGPGFDTLESPLSVTANSVFGTITDIPAGANRLIQVFVRDSSGSLCYYGSSVAQIPANRTTNVPITIVRWNRGIAVISGSIVDTLPTRECYILDSICFPDTGNRSRCYIRTICNGDTILDPFGQTEYPVDTMPEYRCVFLDSVCIPDTGNRSRCYIRTICNGDTILNPLGQTTYPVDTMPEYRCVVLDSSHFVNEYGTIWYVRKICHGDTISDTLFHSDSGCRIVDTGSYADGSGTLRFAGRMCNGQVFSDTVSPDSTPIDAKLIMPNQSADAYYYPGDTIYMGVVIFNGKIACVKKIQFLCDSTTIGVLDSSAVQPYQITSVLTTRKPGIHQLFAIIHDCNGKAWYSNRQPVRVR